MNRENRDIRPLLLLFFLNALGILILLVNGQDSAYTLAVLSAAVCMVSMVVYFIIVRFKLGDPYLFVIVSVISTVGIVFMARLEGLTKATQTIGKSQIIFYLAGTVAFLGVLFIYRKLNQYLHKLGVLYYGVAMAMFLATLLLAKETQGAQNWIDLGFFMIQPTEFIRILFVMALAATLYKSGTARKRKSGIDSDEENQNISYVERKILWRRLAVAAAITFSCVLAMLIQKELGTMVVFCAVYFAFICVYGNSKSFVALNVLVVVMLIVLVPILVNNVGFVREKFNHVENRISAWSDPFKEPTEGGRQTLQSLIAIGTGGFTGTGIGHGTPEDISSHHNDSVFSVICEEMGIMGGIALLMLYFLLVYRGFKVALTTTNGFNKAVAFGLSVALGVQIFIIVGGVIKLIPLTGITLPFVSAGGSSMVSTFMIVGILQSISSMKGEGSDELE